MINANAPVVVVELDRNPLISTSNIEVEVSVISISPTSSGSVVSVNGISPDGNGEVILSPSDIGAASIEDVIAANATLKLSSDLFLSDQETGQPGWDVLLPEATNDAAGEHSRITTVQNTRYELDRYASPALGVTRIPAGALGIDISAKCSSATGVNCLEVQPCIVHSDGSHTIPTGWNPILSSDINNTTAYAIAVFPRTILPAAEGILVTDAFGVIISAVRTSAGAATTIYMCHDLASGCLSHVSPPISIPITIADVQELTAAIEALRPKLATTSDAPAGAYIVQQSDNDKIVDITGNLTLPALLPGTQVKFFNASVGNVSILTSGTTFIPYPANKLSIPPNGTASFVWKTSTLIRGQGALV